MCMFMCCIACISDFLYLSVKVFLPGDDVVISLCIYCQCFLFLLQARIHMGFYSIFMKDWLSVFPREQFFIFRTEDYQKNIGIYMQEIYRFLGVRTYRFAFSLFVTLQKYYFLRLS